MPRVKKTKSYNDIRSQAFRIQDEIENRGGNLNSPRSIRTFSTANRYINNILTTGDWNLNADTQVPRRVYMGISKGSVAR